MLTINYSAKIQTSGHFRHDDPDAFGSILKQNCLTGSPGDLSNHGPGVFSSGSRKTLTATERAIIAEHPVLVRYIPNGVYNHPVTGGTGAGAGTGTGTRETPVTGGTPAKGGGTDTGTGESSVTGGDRASTRDDNARETFDAAAGLLEGGVTPEEQKQLEELALNYIPPEEELIQVNQEGTEIAAGIIEGPKTREYAENWGRMSVSERRKAIEDLVRIVEEALGVTFSKVNFFDEPPKDDLVTGAYFSPMDDSLNVNLNKKALTTFAEVADAISHEAKHLQQKNAVDVTSLDQLKAAVDGGKASFADAYASLGLFEGGYIPGTVDTMAAYQRQGTEVTAHLIGQKVEVELAEAGILGADKDIKAGSPLAGVIEGTVLAPLIG